MRMWPRAGVVYVRGVVSTFWSLGAYFWPPTRTLTVFCMRPADTTTPWSSWVTRLAALVTGYDIFAGSVFGLGNNFVGWTTWRLEKLEKIG
jgi:hypothetical protein